MRLARSGMQLEKVEVKEMERGKGRTLGWAELSRSSLTRLSNFDTIKTERINLHPRERRLLAAAGIERGGEEIFKKKRVSDRRNEGEREREREKEKEKEKERTTIGSRLLVSRFTSRDDPSRFSNRSPSFPSSVNRSCSPNYVRIIRFFTRLEYREKKFYKYRRLSEIFVRSFF